MRLGSPRCCAACSASVHKVSCRRAEAVGRGQDSSHLPRYDSSREEYEPIFAREKSEAKALVDKMLRADVLAEVRAAA